VVSKIKKKRKYPRKKSLRDVSLDVITSTVLTFIVIVNEVLLKGLPKLGRNNDDKKVIYSRPAKVISDAILLVYSLRGVLVKIVRSYHTRWRNLC